MPSRAKTVRERDCPLLASRFPTLGQRVGTPPHLPAASLVPTINRVRMGNRNSSPFRLMFKASRNEFGAFRRLDRISASASVPEDS